MDKTLNLKIILQNANRSSKKLSSEQIVMKLKNLGIEADLCPWRPIQ